MRTLEIVAIVQARMGSTRLPGKVLAEINGRPMLHYTLTRTQQAKKLDGVILATSTGKSDDEVMRFSNEFGVQCFRGSEDDVLDRYYQASRHVGARIIVRITADCPLIDPEIIDQVIDVYEGGDYDYVTNTLPCTYPDGLDVEVFSFGALARAWREAKWLSEREHVTPYIRKHPELFRLGNIMHNEDLSAMRWTVDEPQDLEFVRSVYRHIMRVSFGMDDVLNLLKREPGLTQINVGIGRNEGYQKSLGEDRLVL